MNLPVLLATGEDGFFVAHCPLIPGCISQGKTKEEALANIKEAIELSMEDAEAEGWSIPSQYEFGEVTVGG